MNSYRDPYTQQQGRAVGVSAVGGAGGAGGLTSSSHTTTNAAVGASANAFLHSNHDRCAEMIKLLLTELRWMPHKISLRLNVPIVVIEECSRTGRSSDLLRGQLCHWLKTSGEVPPSVPTALVAAVVAEGQRGAMMGDGGGGHLYGHHYGQDSKSGGGGGMGGRARTGSTAKKPNGHSNLGGGGAAGGSQRSGSPSSATNSPARTAVGFGGFGGRYNDGDYYGDDVDESQSGPYASLDPHTRAQFNYLRRTVGHNFASVLTDPNDPRMLTSNQTAVAWDWLGNTFTEVFIEGGAPTASGPVKPESVSDLLKLHPVSKATFQPYLEQISKLYNENKVEVNKMREFQDIKSAFHRELERVGHEEEHLLLMGGDDGNPLCGDEGDAAAALPWPETVPLTYFDEHYTLEALLRTIPAKKVEPWVAPAVGTKALQTLAVRPKFISTRSSALSNNAANSVVMGAGTAIPLGGNAAAAGGGAGGNTNNPLSVGRGHHHGFAATGVSVASPTANMTPQQHQQMLMMASKGSSQSASSPLANNNNNYHITNPTSTAASMAAIGQVGGGGGSLTSPMMMGGAMNSSPLIDEHDIKAATYIDQLIEECTSNVQNVELCLITHVLSQSEAFFEASKSFEHLRDDSGWILDLLHRTREDVMGKGESVVYQFLNVLRLHRRRARLNDVCHKTVILEKFCDVLRRLNTAQNDEIKRTRQQQLLRNMQSGRVVGGGGVGGGGKAVLGGTVVTPGNSTSSAVAMGGSVVGGNASATTTAGAIVVATTAGSAFNSTSSYPGSPNSAATTAALLNDNGSENIAKITAALTEALRMRFEDGPTTVTTAPSAQAGASTSAFTRTDTRNNSSTTNAAAAQQRANIQQQTSSQQQNQQMVAGANPANPSSSPSSEAADLLGQLKCLNSATAALLMSKRSIQEVVASRGSSVLKPQQWGDTDWADVRRYLESAVEVKALPMIVQEYQRDVTEHIWSVVSKVVVGGVFSPLLQQQQRGSISPPSNNLSSPSAHQQQQPSKSAIEAASNNPNERRAILKRTLSTLKTPHFIAQIADVVNALQDYSIQLVTHLTSLNDLLKEIATEGIRKQRKKERRLKRQQENGGGGGGKSERGGAAAAARRRREVASVLDSTVMTAHHSDGDYGNSSGGLISNTSGSDDDGPHAGMGIMNIPAHDPLSASNAATASPNSPAVDISEIPPSAMMDETSVKAVVLQSLQVAIIEVLESRENETTRMTFSDVEALLRVCFAFANDIEGFFGFPQNSQTRPFRATLQTIARSFARHQHERQQEKMLKVLEHEQWIPNDSIERAYQIYCDHLCDSTRDAVDQFTALSVEKSSLTVADGTAAKAAAGINARTESEHFEKRLFIPSGTDNAMDSTTCAPMIAAAGGAAVSDATTTNPNAAFVVPNSLLILMQSLNDYDRYLAAFPFLAPDLVMRFHDALKLYDGQCAGLVLGAGAVEMGSLQAITVAHLALSSQCAGFLAELTPRLQRRLRYATGVEVHGATGAIYAIPSVIPTAANTVMNTAANSINASALNSTSSQAAATAAVANRMMLGQGMNISNSGAGPLVTGVVVGGMASGVVVQGQAVSSTSSAVGTIIASGSVNLNVAKTTVVSAQTTPAMTPNTVANPTAATNKVAPFLAHLDRVRKDLHEHRCEYMAKIAAMVKDKIDGSLWLGGGGGKNGAATALKSGGSSNPSPISPKTAPNADPTSAANAGKDLQNQTQQPPNTFDPLQWPSQGTNWVMGMLKETARIIKAVKPIVRPIDQQGIVVPVLSIIISKIVEAIRHVQKVHSPSTGGNAGTLTGTAMMPAAIKEAIMADLALLKANIEKFGYDTVQCGRLKGGVKAALLMIVTPSADAEFNALFFG